MKKVLVAFVLIMAVVAVNVQAAQAAQDKSERSPVMVADLPKTITDNIAKDYAGYTIKEATKVTTKGVATYEVVVTKEMVTETLEYDTAGKFVKKLPPPKM